MLARTLLLSFATLASLASAVAIDSSSSSSVIRLTGPASIGESASDDNLSINGTSPILEPRSGGARAYCGCGISMNTGDTNADVAAMINSHVWGVYLEANTATAEISGNVVTFVCNYSTDVAVNVGVSLFESALKNAVSRCCGSFIAGTYEAWLVSSQADRLANVAIGYMLWNSQSLSQVCGAARSSSKNVYLYSNDPAIGDYPGVC